MRKVNYLLRMQFVGSFCRNLSRAFREMSRQGLDIYPRVSLNDRFRVRFVASPPLPALALRLLLPPPSFLTFNRALPPLLSTCCMSTLSRDREIVPPEFQDTRQQLKSWKNNSISENSQFSLLSRHFRGDIPE